MTSSSRFRDTVIRAPRGAELNAKDMAIALEIAHSPLVKYLKEPIPIPPADQSADPATAALQPRLT